MYVIWGSTVTKAIPIDLWSMFLSACDGIDILNFPMVGLQYVLIYVQGHHEQHNIGPKDGLQIL